MEARVQLERPEDGFDRDRLTATVCQQHGHPVWLRVEHHVPVDSTGGLEAVICGYRNGKGKVLYAAWERLEGDCEGQALVVEKDDGEVVSPHDAALEFIRRLEDYQRPDQVSG